MQRYIGTKRLKAKPMTRGEYNSYRGWLTPEDENQYEAGYLVEYEDGGKPNHPNHPNHGGYISWSSADVFERTYQPIPAVVAGSARQAGPKVSMDDIEANILEAHYSTALAVATLHGAVNPHPRLGLLTICVLVLRNGFIVTGESACVSPENFNAAAGCNYARQNAIEKIWPLMGYELRSKLAAAEETQPVSPGLTD